MLKIQKGKILLWMITAASVLTLWSIPVPDVVAAEEPHTVELPEAGPTSESFAEEPTLELSAEEQSMAELPEAEPASELPAEVELLSETAMEMALPESENVSEEPVAEEISVKQYHIIDILGDSITEGVGARTPDKAYPSVLSRLTGARVNNYGLSCSRITDITGGLSNPGSFIDRMYAMDKSADLLIVFGGTNDFWFGDCPIGKRTDTQVNTFYGALNKMIPYLKNAHPNADIVFITPYQQSKDADETHPYKRSTYNNFGTGTLRQYRTALLDRCEYYGIPVLDLYADYDLNTADNRQALEKYGNFICDGCHLNDAGYDLLARKIYDFIMQDFSLYVPEYTEINDMVFETAALPALIKDGCFVMPDGQVIFCRPEFELDPFMPLQQLYQILIHSAMYEFDESTAI